MKYRTIVVDPPWDQRYSPNTVGTTRQRLTNIGATVVPRTRPPYPTLSLHKIRALPVRSFADTSGCNLFLWATNSTLRHVWELLEVWGFRYSQTLVWQKTNPSQLSGHGSFAVMDIEFLVVGRLGRCIFQDRLKSSVFASAGGSRRGSDGSSKPPGLLDEIERVSPGPYLELFARRQRLGWDTWGNEALEHVEVSA